MNKTELRSWLYNLGIKATTITDEGAEKIQEWKDSLNTDTRRVVRKYWMGISIIAFLVGIFIGIYI